MDGGAPAAAFMARAGPDDRASSLRQPGAGIPGQPAALPGCARESGSAGILCQSGIDCRAGGQAACRLPARGSPASLDGCIRNVGESSLQGDHRAHDCVPVGWTRCRIPRPQSCGVMHRRRTATAAAPPPHRMRRRPPLPHRQQPISGADTSRPSSRQRRAAQGRSADSAAALHGLAAASAGAARMCPRFRSTPPRPAAAGVGPHVLRHAVRPLGCHPLHTMITPQALPPLHPMGSPVAHAAATQHARKGS